MAPAVAPAARGEATANRLAVGGGRAYAEIIPRQRAGGVTREADSLPRLLLVGTARGTRRAYVFAGYASEGAR